MKISFIYTQPVQFRWLSIDVLRGFAMIILIPEIFLAHYKILPNWLWHAEWNGLGIADFGVPVFLFALGMSYQLSFQNRLLQSGLKATTFHFLKRYLTLFIFGFLGSILAMGKFQWEVLQVIGIAGIYTLLFMLIRPLYRLILALILIIIYQLTIMNGAKGLVLKFSESGLGGPYATLAWGLIVTLGSVVISWLNGVTTTKEKIERLILIVTSLIISGVICSLFIPFNKHLISLSYVIFTTGIACGGFLLCFIFGDKWQRQLSVFSLVGKNALVCYILSQLLTIIAVKILPNNISLWLVIFCSLILLFSCLGMALILDARKIYLRL